MNGGRAVSNITPEEAIQIAEEVEFDPTKISAAKKTAMEKGFEKAKQRVKQAFREYFKSKEATLHIKAHPAEMRGTSLLSRREVH